MDQETEKKIKELQLLILMAEEVTAQINSKLCDLSRDIKIQEIKELQAIAAATSRHNLGEARR